MAKVSMVQREKKRARTVKKYAKKRAELKATIKNLSVSFEEREAAARGPGAAARGRGCGHRRAGRRRFSRWSLRARR